MFLNGGGVLPVAGICVNFLVSVAADDDGHFPSPAPSVRERRMRVLRETLLFEGRLSTTRQNTHRYRGGSWLWACFERSMVGWVWCVDMSV